MVRLNINLDESLKAYADEQVANGRARNIDEFLASLIDQARNNASSEAGSDEHTANLRLEIEKGIDSGPAAPWTAADFQAARHRIQSRHPNRG